MPQVHTFTDVTQLFTDTKFPLQFLGGGNSPAARQVAMSVLLDFIAENLEIAPPAWQSVANNGTISIAADKLIEVIVIEGDASTRTISVGTSALGTDVADAEPQSANTPLVIRRDIYTNGATTLHFWGFSGTINVKIYQR